MTTPEKIGMRIQEFRKKRDMTQETLAKKAGISRGYLARLETGRHDPSLAMLRTLADVLKVKLVDLVK